LHTGADDLGVQSVKQIYSHFRKFGYATEMMGASFRNTSKISELAGFDLLKISPDLLQKLAEKRCYGHPQAELGRCATKRYQKDQFRRNHIPYDAERRCNGDPKIGRRNMSV